MTDHDQPIATPPAQKLEDFRRRTVPVLVWAVAAVVCVALMVQRTHNFEYIGIAQAFEYQVSAAATGTLESVPVRLYDSVEAGEVVARLDDSPLRASLETARATVGQLSAELEAARIDAAAGSANLIGELRRFQVDEEERRLAVLNLRVEIETDRVQRERLELELRRSAPLVESGLISQQMFDDLQLRHRQVSRRIDDNAVLLEQTEQELQVARARRQAYEEELTPQQRGDVLLQPLREAITVATREMEEIELQLQATLLRSPVAGQVTQVLCRQGQAVRPGDPIVTVSEPFPSEIVAYLTESDRAAPRRGTRVLVASRRDPGRTAESLVVRDGHTVQPFPQRLWRDGRTPTYGRAVVIAGVPALDLAPGELVSVRFLPAD